MVIDDDTTIPVVVGNVFPFSKTSLIPNHRLRGAIGATLETMVSGIILAR
jgi:hypothetical protein